MWKILQQSPAYFIKFDIEKDDYVVSVTNYLNIWVTRLTKKSFLQVLKDSDEDTVFDDDEDLLQKGVKMLSHPELLKTVIISENEGRRGTLKLSMTKLYGFLMFFNLSLTLCSNVCMFKEVIQPLLRTVKDLRESQTELRQELKKKDKEIEEYKCEGGEIALRHLKTVMFDDTKHMNKHKQYEDNLSEELIEQLLKPIEESIYSTVNCNSSNNIQMTETKQENAEANVNKTIKSENPNQYNNETVSVKIEPSSQGHRIENSTVKPETDISTISENMKTELNSGNDASETTPIKSEPSSQGSKSQNLIATPPRKRQRNRLNF